MIDVGKERNYIMLNAINNSVATSEVTQPEQKVSNNIAYRGGSDYERTPYADSFESEEKKSSAGKTVGIIAGVLAAAALVVGGICLHKGGKALEGAEEAEKTFGKKLKKGWEELWNKGEKAAKEGAENAKGAGEGATPAAEAPKPEATPPAAPAETPEKPAGA
jgi:hypothetical protein